MKAGLIFLNSLHVHIKYICSDDSLHGDAIVTVKFLVHNTVKSALSFFSFVLAALMPKRVRVSHFGPRLIAKIDSYFGH